MGRSRVLQNSLMANEIFPQSLKPAIPWPQYDPAEAGPFQNFYLGNIL